MATSVAVTLPALRLSASSAFSVTMLRAFVTTDLSDSALQVLLDAASDAVADVLGPATLRERIPPVSGDMLILGRPAETVTAVVEDAGRSAVALAADDWMLSDSGRVLYRLRAGTHPASAWRGRVDVTYVRGDDAAARTRAVVALVELDLQGGRGLVSQQIGTWTETYRTDAEYVATRESILAALTTTGEGFVW